MAIQLRSIQVLICAAGLLQAAGPVSAQGPVAGTTGQATYATYCATCHGAGGKGDGPVAASLKQRPADLTLIAKRNGGLFTPEHVAQTIDGRKPLKGHGGGEMPVWGEAFAKASSDTPVEERIRRLVRYLESLQATP